MAINPQLFHAKVMHRRLFPKVNHFSYRIYYVLLPLAQLAKIRALAINRRGLISVKEVQYGARQRGASLQTWARDVLKAYGLDVPVNDIALLTMPSILGYGFNPVSFYLCLDESGALRAVISEVHNTFGESHSYLAALADARPITAEDWLEARKLFHVSPFLAREGSYRFRFDYRGEKLGIWIDYLDESGHTQLITSLIGTLKPLSRAAMWRAFFAYPLVTLKTISLIHWKAFKLFSKGIRYIVKPEQKPQQISATTNLTKR